MSLGWKISSTSRNEDIHNINFFNYYKVNKDAFQDVTRVLVFR
ncbi:hypothetical protein [Wolbachia endosymbiont of Litomosoides brasiliensis]|nr:hypothetical protein [Wolbachia endosymbiont of Litomosoides brasiliensis]